MRCFIATLAVLFFVHTNFSAENGKVFELRQVFEKASESTVPMDFTSGQRTETLHVGKNALLDGSAVKSARHATDPVSGEPIVDVTFNEDGAKKFSDITAQNIGKRIAILVNGKVYTAPIVRTRIAGGRAHIAGNLTKEQAEELVGIINGAVGKKGAAQ
jgi:preprotein translocase subunit SecD